MRNQADSTRCWQVPLGLLKTTLCSTSAGNTLKTPRLEVNAQSESSHTALPSSDHDPQSFPEPSAADISDILAKWKIFGGLDRTSPGAPYVDPTSPSMTFPRTDAKAATMHLPRPVVEKLRESNSKQLTELWELRTTLQRSMGRMHLFQCLERKLASARTAVAESFADLENGNSKVRTMGETNAKKLQRVKGVTRDLGLKCKLASARLSHFPATILACEKMQCLDGQWVFSFEVS